MGAESSTFCSPTSGQRQPMQVSSAMTVQHDKIDPWSTDLGVAADLPSRLVATLTCGGSTAPPADYLADSQREDDLIMGPDPDVINQNPSTEFFLPLKSG
eukprot:CAMPEP_0179166790 /NCGR_PEP_ID=MMETSP0796-20121207/81963_1 /TAXON_ID=73915 /ORGANISM="Pyrodinium bahamense, Strain pbaha01" /LENGTH=99 /DNA_ID=CAMNT_0020869415 /DNA_START=73 /DNA_END=372 /DNA_ORIENTATION=+